MIILIYIAILVLLTAWVSVCIRLTLKARRVIATSRTEFATLESKYLQLGRENQTLLAEVRKNRRRLTAIDTESPAPAAATFDSRFNITEDDDPFAVA